MDNGLGGGLESYCGELPHSDPTRDAQLGHQKYWHQDANLKFIDSDPIQAAGEFDSHGKPVTPQSLYLVQLQERLNTNVIRNMSYVTNSAAEFKNKSVKPLPPKIKETDIRYVENLALHRPITASTSCGKTRAFSAERIVDGNPTTYWAADDSTRNAIIELDMENPVAINMLTLGEQNGFINRISDFKVEGYTNSNWTLPGQGKTIGRLQVH